jgi:hypothetical protein
LKKQNNVRYIFYSSTNKNIVCLVTLSQHHLFIFVRDSFFMFRVRPNPVGGLFYFGAGRDELF